MYETGSNSGADSAADTDSQPCFSDDEDIFRMRAAAPEAMPAAYNESTLEIRQRAVRRVKEMIRAEPLLPLDPFRDKDEEPETEDEKPRPRPYTDVCTPLLWPSWHCPFGNCSACGLARYEKKQSLGT